MTTMNSRYKLSIVEEWPNDFQDLTIYDNLDGSFELAALSSSSLSYWKSSSNEPKVVSAGRYRKDTLYISKHPDALYLWAYNETSSQIDSINLSNNKSYQIAMPDNFVLNHVTYYCSARLDKTICLVQGTVGGWSTLYYSALSSEGSFTTWADWGRSWVGKPVVVEADSTLWVYVTFCEKNDYENVGYLWCWTAALDWGKWHQMDHIGIDWHINSIAGVNGRRTGSGHGVIVTNAEGAHFIKATGGHDDWPAATGKTIDDSFYRSSVTKAGGTTSGNVGGFVHLKNGVLSMIDNKEDALHTDSLEEDVMAFSVSQLSEDDDKSTGFPIVFCKGSATYLARIVSIV